MKLSSWLRLFHSRPTTRELSSGSKGLTSGWKSVRLDKVGSVSGLKLIETHWDDAVINEQYQRFLNGS